MLAHYRVIGAATTENAAVYFGVQRFHPTVHHFGETGVVGDFGHSNAVVLQQAEGAASRQQFDAHLGELAGKIDDA